MARALADLVAEEPQLAGRQPSEWVDSRFVRELESKGLRRARRRPAGPVPLLAIKLLEEASLQYFIEH